MTTNSAAAALSGDLAAPAAASAPATEAGGTQNTPAPASNDVWYSGIQNPEVRTWAEAKGFKDPLAVAESAYNLEKMIGFDRAGRTIVLPDENSTPDQISAFHQKIGVPESADKYDLGLEGDFSKTAAEWMHKHNVPADAAKGITQEWKGYIEAQQEAAAKEFAVRSEQEFNGLKSEWGKAFDQNLEMAKRAAREFLPAANDAERSEMLQALEKVTGTEKMLKFFQRIGEGLGEHKFHGDGGGGIMTPAQAQQRIAELKSNSDWSAKYLAGDKAAMKELTDLISLAHPEG